jgi:hypothetical protein
MCAHCLGQPDPEAEARKLRAALLDSGWMAAVYPGTCEHCGERFEAGAAIRMDLRLGWRAECCAEVTR